MDKSSSKPPSSPPRYQRIASPEEGRKCPGAPSKEEVLEIEAPSNRFMEGLIPEILPKAQGRVQVVKILFRCHSEWIPDQKIYKGTPPSRPVVFSGMLWVPTDPEYNGEPIEGAGTWRPVFGKLAWGPTSKLPSNILKEHKLTSIVASQADKMGKPGCVRHPVALFYNQDENAALFLTERDSEPEMATLIDHLLRVNEAVHDPRTSLAELRENAQVLKEILNALEGLREAITVVIQGGIDMPRLVFCDVKPDNIACALDWKLVDGSWRVEVDLSLFDWASALPVHTQIPLYKLEGTRDYLPPALQALHEEAQWHSQGGAKGLSRKVMETPITVGPEIDDYSWGVTRNLVTRLSCELDEAIAIAEASHAMPPESYGSEFDAYRVVEGVAAV